jgi:hypothetical protein
MQSREGANGSDLKCFGGPYVGPKSGFSSSKSGEANNTKLGPIWRADTIGGLEQYDTNERGCS